MGPAPTLIVADDDEIARATLAALFRGAGYAVREATDGAVALVIIDEIVPARCIVFLDVRLPVLSGEEVLRALHARQRLPDLPVVLTSDARPCPTIAEGACMWLRKPLVPDVVLNVVSRLTDDSVVKRCVCGHVYTRAEWNRLPFVSYLSTGRDVAGDLLELRHCQCGSSIAIDLGDQPDSWSNVATVDRVSSDGG